MSWHHDRMIVEREIPELANCSFEIDSPQTISYNCIAWAAEVDYLWMWPKGDYYWPLDVPKDERVSSFVACFSKIGYNICSSESLEQGFDKVAIFARGNAVTHAARQKLDGTWTSKLGSLNDITHSLHDLEGNGYGSVVQILRRPQVV